MTDHGKQLDFNISIGNESFIKRIEQLEKENAELKLKNEKLYRTLDHLRENKNRKQKKIEEMQEGEVARFECWNNRLTKLEKENAKLKAQNESLKDTLQAIATDTNEHITHNVAQNELDKWELAEK